MIAEGYEATPRRLIRSHVEPRHRVLEVGAGIGGVTTELEKVASCVIACEPQLYPYSLLADNTESAFVLPVAVGVGNERRLMMDLQPDWHCSHVSAYGAEVAAVPIHRLLSQWEINALVMDCEGYEAEILCALTQQELARLELVAAELHWNLVRISQLRLGLERLERAGFELVESQVPHPEPDIDYVIYAKRNVREVS